MESYINERLNLTIADLMILDTKNVYYAGRSVRQVPSDILTYKMEPKHTKDEVKLLKKEKKELKKARLENKALKLKEKQKRKIEKGKAEVVRMPHGNVTRPVFSKGQLKQTQDLKPLMTAWDEMLVAGAYPGQFNVRYVAGMNCTNLPTSTFSVSNTFSESHVKGDDTTATHPLGTNDYTLIMFCPSATAFNGGTESWSIPNSDKLGGLTIVQYSGNQLDDPHVDKNLFRYAPASMTMRETYGSNLTGFSSGGFIWASEATINVLAPAANMVGSYYRGTIQYGQIPKSGQPGLTLRELIEIAGDVEVMEPQFHMRIKVVNHDLVYDTQDSSKTLESSDFAGELVQYVILQKPAINITSGDNAKFSLQCNFKGNTVFWGKAEDSIANNLFKNNRQQKSPMPGVLAGVTQNNEQKPKAVNSLLEGAGHLLSKAWEHKDTLTAVASTVGSFLPMLLADDADPVAIKTDYLQTLNEAQRHLLQLKEQNKFLDLSDMQQILQKEIERIKLIPGRIVVLHDPNPPKESEVIEKYQPQTPGLQSHHG